MFGTIYAPKALLSGAAFATSLLLTNPAEAYDLDAGDSSYTSNLPPCSDVKSTVTPFTAIPFDEDVFVKDQTAHGFGVCKFSPESNVNYGTYPLSTMLEHGTWITNLPSWVFDGLALCIAALLGASTGVLLDRCRIKAMRKASAERNKLRPAETEKDNLMMGPRGRERLDPLEAQKIAKTNPPPSKHLDGNPNPDGTPPSFKLEAASEPPASQRPQLELRLALRDPLNPSWSNEVIEGFELEQKPPTAKPDKPSGS